MGPSGAADPGEQNDRSGNSGRGRRTTGSLTKLWVWILVVAAVVALIVVARQHLAFLFGVLIFVVALLVSVMLHEFGHFATAKKFGMRVTQFFIGFGQTLWSIFWGETEYGVKALPFGGFVKITGMTSIEEIDVADEPRSFRNQPGWQRIIVLAAGSFMHFVLALFLFFVLAFAIGQPKLLTDGHVDLAGCVPASAKALDSTNPCAGHNLGKSPAQVAGLKAGDKIISVAGKPVATWNQLHTALGAEKAGTAVPIVVERDGRSLHLSVTLAAIPGRDTGYLGVEQAVVYQRSSFFGGWGFAGDQFASTLTSSASAIAKLPGAIPDLFNQNRSHTAAGQVTSVVGVGEVTGDVVQAALPWQAKISVLLAIVASLNIFVGAFNLLPLLPLDGGHLAVVIFERIRAWFNRILGRPDPGLVDIQRLVPLSLLVFAVLVGLGTLLIAADIFNPVHLQV
ncbi:MAG TPA: site-2 protease family protein [Streptosporangiaceae bacterium]|nr:site-2 protease family protein [Streptosporangiaceae bacterium]